ncbi:hypothetical protein C9J03_09745 [Photobacterium gaetbulicola]|uniref:hypothetical protein n=1 Tax=Photobacterium gaetbulicola TaxID=1295392 RepID=UPI0005CC54D1|nr:hypothetical protein [Photobacterium gaetbulicola]PSU12313.1 hypothetical protein C9J03_09745 [Photobacterium gaetbulicola]
MRKSWINTNDQAQEIWARKYLIKKQAEMTSSGDGLTASQKWDSQQPALNFLHSLEQRTNCEASSVLLKKMKAAWDQQVRKSQAKKTRPVYISLKSSNQLKLLAKANGQTLVTTMEGLIFGQYQEHRLLIEQEKEQRNRDKQLIKKLENKINNINNENFYLKEEIDTYLRKISHLKCELKTNQKKLDEMMIKEKNENSFWAKKTIKHLENE